MPRNRLRSRGAMNRIASPLRPARPGPADAMHVGFRIVRRIVVHDVADALDVEAAGRDVGGDDDVHVAGLQPGDGAFALRLRDVAVERRRGEAARLELLRELHRGLLGAGEHQHAVEGLGLENSGQRIELVQSAHQPVALADIGRGAGLALDGDFDRRAQVFLRDAPDRRRAGSRRTGPPAGCGGVLPRMASTASRKPMRSISSASSSTSSLSEASLRVPRSR